MYTTEYNTDLHGEIFLLPDPPIHKQIGAELGGSQCRVSLTLKDSGSGN